VSPFGPWGPTAPMAPLGPHEPSAPPSSSQRCTAAASCASCAALLRWRRHQARLAHCSLQYFRRPTPSAGVPQIGQTTALGLRRAASWRASSLKSVVMFVIREG
jgi:hypothetical protein